MLVPDLIVSRHAGAIRWLCAHLLPNHHRALIDGDTLVWVPIEHDEENTPYLRIPVFAEATPELVADKIVCGNLPLWLACQCRAVIAIEFGGTAPRGAEYTADDMETSGAKLVAYRVTAAE